MKIEIEYTEKELKQLIRNDLELKLGDMPFDEKNISILVKSKQNYKSEWEVANFKAVYQTK